MHWLLYPFSLLFGLIVYLRNKLFDLQLLKSTRFPIPVIVVGNITVGGTGKTPHIEYLVRLLSDKYPIATLSRGYKRRTKGFLEADENTTAAQVGDEPQQIKSKFPKVIVAVDEDRVHGIQKLIHSNNPPDIILLDDAFQHRKVKAGLNIVLIDFNRPINKDYLMPMGRLREPVKNIKRAEIVIVTKCPAVISEDFQNQFKQSIPMCANQKIFFTTFKYDSLKPVFNQNLDALPLDLIRNKDILIVTGIAQPEPIYQQFNLNGNKIHKLRFSDHHDFSETDIVNINDTYKKIDQGNTIIICTEKDAIRLRTSKGNKLLQNKPVYYLPIKVSFVDGKQNEFDQEIMSFIEMLKRN